MQFINVIKNIFFFDKSRGGERIPHLNGILKFGYSHLVTNTPSDFVGANKEYKALAIIEHQNCGKLEKFLVNSHAVADHPRGKLYFAHRSSLTTPQPRG